MRMYDLILKKREGKELSSPEIAFIIDSYQKELIPDYQIAAWLMAVCFQGLTIAETTALTKAMVNSGVTCNLSSFPGPTVDKHSTGGVGDKTTLIVGPLVAACQVPVIKISGPGLGHTGGTVDKLQSIRGFNPYLGQNQLIRQVAEIGIGVTAQTAEMVPADGKLYKLRDVTGTVDSIPLIASSIMSKKIASGADAILLDVKCGNGAFIQNHESALSLAQLMVYIGRGLGRRAKALVTRMDQPLGYYVGNALEVQEAIGVLSGEIMSPDLLELCCTLAAHMVLAGEQAHSYAHAERMVKNVLGNGAALQKFREWITAQNGDPRIIENQNLLPQAGCREKIEAVSEGYVEEMHARTIGKAAAILGAGRETKGGEIDYAVGVRLHKKIGTWVQRGEPVFTIHHNGKGAQEAAELLQTAVRIGPRKIGLNTVVESVC